MTERCRRENKIFGKNEQWIKIAVKRIRLESLHQSDDNDGDVYGYFAYMYVCSKCSCSVEKIVMSLGTRITDGCVSPCGYWKLSLGARAVSDLKHQEISSASEIIS